jgi:hypothetical protein
MGLSPMVVLPQFNSSEGKNEMLLTLTNMGANRVKVPTASHATDTVIYMCYGNASITTDQSNKTGVWDSNFKGVWHLNDNAANTVVSDSPGANNGTNQANTSSKTTNGKTAKALLYNNSSDYTDMATNVGNYTLSDSFTVEAWVNPALDSANRAIFGNAYALAGYLLRVTTANKVWTKTV